jgi:hypothetical protein
MFANSSAKTGLDNANRTPNQKAKTITIKLSINKSCITAFLVSLSSGFGLC